VYGQHFQCRKSGQSSDVQAKQQWLLYPSQQQTEAASLPCKIAALNEGRDVPGQPERQVANTVHIKKKEACRDQMQAMGSTTITYLRPSRRDEALNLESDRSIYMMREWAPKPSLPVPT
jgi:hypothetical protein